MSTCDDGIVASNSCVLLKLGNAGGEDDANFVGVMIFSMIVDVDDDGGGVRDRTKKSFDVSNR